MKEKQVFGFLGGLAAFLILIALILPRDRGPDGPDVGELIAEEIAQEVAPLSEAVSGLSERVETMEGALGSLSEQVDAAQSTEALDALNTRVDEAVAQTGTLSQDIAAVKSALDETNAAVASVADAASAAPAAAAAPAPATEDTAAAAEETTSDDAAAAADTSEASGGFGPGQTALFADGGLRMFISRVDEAAGEVRVSVDRQMKAMAVGSARTFAVGDDFCRVTVAGISGNAAAFDALCGDDLPAPEGISVGNTAVLADGAIRVFASRVTEDGARLSINRELVSLDVGRSAPVETEGDSCRVFLVGVDRGHAQASVQCGDAVAVSEMVGPGATVVLNDGALRIFVSGISDDAVRFAVNGQTLVSGASGDRADAGEGCSVTVEDIADGKASFSHSCDG